jgi:hypothetical protein
MSDGIFYWWLQDAAMDRRSLLTLVAGAALGWTGATVLDDDSPAAGGSDGDAGKASGTQSPTTDSPTPPPTDEPTETATATAEPTATTETTESPTATVEPTETATPTPESNSALQGNLDVYSRGFDDDGSYKVLYSIRNENDVAVEVTFEATVSLRNSNSDLREVRTATIDPGQAASDEFVFDEYESSPTGYGFRPLRTVEA